MLAVVLPVMTAPNWRKSDRRFQLWGMVLAGNAWSRLVIIAQ